VSDTNEILAQLRQLGELRDAGVLTDHEFEAQKARILARSDGLDESFRTKPPDVDERAVPFLRFLGGPAGRPLSGWLAPLHVT